MALRNATALKYQPRSVSDAIDGTNAFKGALAAAQNLVPAPHTPGLWVPRPAATIQTPFGGFTAPLAGECIEVVGNRIYGLVASGRFAGHSEPFVYDTAASAFVAVSGVTSGNTPAAAATTGDWTPPTAARIGGRVLFTHPGFSLPNAFGWLDMTGFSDATRLGNTHTSTTIDTLSANVLQAGWRPGMTISDSAGDLPAGCRIVSIAANGLSLVVSAAATASTAGTTFTVAGGTAGAPLWCAGNLNQNPLLGVASAVAQFFGRAYLAVGNVLAFSDSGDPVQATNSRNVQALTFQNGLAITALAGLPLNNLSGGIIQALMVFQGAAAIQQVTGDDSLQNLAVNTLNEATGTLAPNTVATTPMGLMFVAPDGVRNIGFNGLVSEPIGANGEGVTLPFINAVTPSRMCAAYNEDVYRISVTGNILAGGQVTNTIATNEFWYHLKMRCWSGPHTFPAKLIAASQTSQAFYLFPTGATGLWSSAPLPTSNSVYTENGAAMACSLQTCLLPDTGAMAENAVVETALALALPPPGTVTVTAANEAGQVLDTQQLSSIGSAAAVWGTAVWGSAVWGIGTAALQQRRVPWAQPLVFKQMQVTVGGIAAAGVVIGNLDLKYQTLGYLMQGLANAV